ncbi:MAG TPA: M1 family aminopeptidase, partial [Patescibacteria group bacterium]|nr:M1 family aminopeptidase [Patescibacteria group bacterium]
IAHVSFDLAAVKGPLVLDFAGESVGRVESERDTVAFDFENEHVVIPQRYLRPGENHFNIQCRPDEAPLHREEDHLYSLFVPARAREVFPCFDQPDMKARFTLVLTIPEDFTAVSNAAVEREFVDGGHKQIHFEETAPLSTYHFAFAAGAFHVETAERGGRTMHLYHMEHDSAKVARNLDVIFDLHAGALRWMEEYTGIGYPFGKFDFVALQSFPYSGMEHPGSIFYRAERLFLEESATEMDRLRRASVISHETAHMWFGDLVTMTWFNDVWLKEAFAQFMADRIVRPVFPGIDHRLLFAASHYDKLYNVERTAGTNQIRQELGNLAGAGSLYGDIIYHKPPVMLNQLEAMMGEGPLQKGLRRYLDSYRFANAGWEDLVAILDALTVRDLRAWSGAWVMERGRPRIAAERMRDESGTCRELRIVQEDPLGRGLVWPQAFTLLVTDGSRDAIVACELNGAEARVKLDEPITDNDFILPCAEGAGFGYFMLDEANRRFLRRSPPHFGEALHRCTYALLLHDNVLGGDFEDITLFTRILMSALEHETAEMNLQSILDYLVETFWCFLSDTERGERAGEIERLLLEKMAGSPEQSAKSACFKAFRSIAVTGDGVRILQDVWEKKRSIEGLNLSERDYSDLACALAVRGVPDWRGILDVQEERITDDQLRERFRFARRAASADRGERDSFFAGLSDVENRRHEPWVLEALSYLHHPLRARESEAYILPSLELIEEIRSTGDIFFPRDWIGTTLLYHHSDGAVRMVRDFLGDRPDYPERLRLIILQAADLPLRANMIRTGGR